jgi:hypothetical protein
MGSVCFKKLQQKILFFFRDLKFRKKHKKFFVYNNEEIIASFNIVIENDRIVLPKYNLYSPINYKQLSGTKLSSLNSMQFIINSEINDFLFKKFIFLMTIALMILGRLHGTVILTSQKVIRFE